MEKTHEPGKGFCFSRKRNELHFLVNLSHFFGPLFAFRVDLDSMATFKWEGRLGSSSKTLWSCVYGQSSCWTSDLASRRQCGRSDGGFKLSGSLFGTSYITLYSPHHRDCGFCPHHPKALYARTSKNSPSFCWSLRLVIQTKWLILKLYVKRKNDLLPEKVFFF